MGGKVWGGQEQGDLRKEFNLRLEGNKDENKGGTKAIPGEKHSDTCPHHLRSQSQHLEVFRNQLGKLEGKEGRHWV